MHRQLAREIPPLGVLDHIDLADQVGDRDIRRGQLFVIAIVAADPFDRCVVSLGGDQVARMLGNRRERIVVNLGSGDDRNCLIEQPDQLAQHPRLGLAAQPEKQDVVLRQDRVLNLRHDRFIVAQYARKKRLARFQKGDQVAPHLILDRLDPITARRELPKRPGPIHRHHHLPLRLLISPALDENTPPHARNQGPGSQRSDRTLTFIYIIAVG